MTIYLFGYGSIINIKNIKEINRKIEYYPVTINNMMRGLITCGNNNLYLGAIDYFMKECNGIIFTPFNI
jgi:hypothetical protein